jgi:hydrogenase expression/formation protein HypC
MCLSIPSKVMEIDDDNVATVDTMGVRRKVSLDLVGDEIHIGDYVLIHIGFAMGKIDEADALESLKLYAEIIDQMEEAQKRELIHESDMCPGRELP